jgi:hypothetical protein
MRTTNHPLEPEELMAYLDGELQTDRAALVAEHLAGCMECQEISAGIRVLSDRMMEWRIEIPPMAIPQTPMNRGPLQHPFYRRRWVWAAAAACLFPIFVLVAHRNGESRLALDAGVTSTPHTRVRRAALKQAGAPIAEFNPQPQPPLIAHTARLNLLASNFDRTHDLLQAIITRHHGYIAELTINADAGSARSLDATVKTPSAQLDATMAEIKELGRVSSESRGGEEVTQQSIDLDARLANARNTEQRLTDLLKHRTDKLADILAIEDQISQTRGQIEQMEAERKNLNHRIEYASLEVHLSEEYKAQISGSRTTTSTQLHNAAVDGLAAVTGSLLDAVTFLLSYGPLTLVWGAILFFPIRFAWRLARRA